MARKKIREYDSKRLLKAHIARLAGLDLPIRVAQVTQGTNFADLAAGERRGRRGGTADCMQAGRQGKIPCVLFALFLPLNPPLPLLTASHPPATTPTPPHPPVQPTPG